ncbi:MAG: methylated-DNA--[protein]-cysteine S-methyltransferase [Oscillospiraceae bacterium]
MENDKTGKTKTAYLSSPVGLLRVGETDGALTELSFAETPGVSEESPLLEETARQLAAYFRGERRVFDLPLSPSGTDFQRRCWAALGEIPYGETRSYGQQAALAGSPRAVRAVGGANHRNPIAIVIPCHRVVGADGSLTGYGGGLATKQFLLDLERAHGETIK